MILRTSAVGIIVALLASGAQAATLVIDNADPAGQGLNDPTPFTPIGGNTGKTLGAARQAVFAQAAAIWGTELSSTVPIHVSVQMTALPCTATTAVLASTGSGSAHRDFPSAPLPATWYPQALANALAGTDLDPSSPDIETAFNGALGGSGCLAGTTFYLGLDAHPGSNQFDLLTIVLHELTHGLGFESFTDFTTGEKMSGDDDAFELNMQEQGASPSAVSTMTDAQRVSAALSDPDLYWAGASVQAAATTLSAGLIAGHVRLYAPSTFAPGASVAHYSTALTPNQLMEPFYTGPTRDLSLAVDLLRDIGWSRVSAAATVPAVTAGQSALLALALLVVAFAGRTIASMRTAASSAASSGPPPFRSDMEHEQPPPPPLDGAGLASVEDAASGTETATAQPPSASLKPGSHATVKDRLGALAATSRE
jgi:hypothetical protein